MLKRLVSKLKQQKQLPYIGAFKETLAQAIFWGSIANWAMVAGTFYFTTLRYVAPWFKLPAFILTVFIGAIVVFFLEYKFVVPSIWAFRGQQMGVNQHNIRKGKEQIVAVSGGFDPLHTGHIRYIEEATHYGKVLVILSRDDQLIAKAKTMGDLGNWKPVPYDVRRDIVEWGLQGRGIVVPSIDNDISCRESISFYKPDIFAKGGDSWDVKNLPEKEVCDRLGVKIIFGVGGYDKPYSSATLRS